MPGKLFRDSIHGDLRINDFELQLIDSPVFQRLRRIKQIGLNYLVYPGANHTRFEHSIGTMFLTSKLCDYLGLDAHEKDKLRVAALLHDVGHGPLSHVSEALLDLPHEEACREVLYNSTTADLISKKFDCDEIIDIILGKGKLGPIISGELDMDRMDYLMRDSHYTGVAYGVIDVERLISNFRLRKHLVLNIKGVQAAEAALVARYFMYPIVYQHHTTRIAGSMVRRALRFCINESVIEPNDLFSMDDYDFINMLRSQEGFIKDIANRIDNRQLLKKVGSINLNSFKNPNDVYKISPELLREAERNIADDMDIDEKYIIISIPKYPSFHEMKTQVEMDDKLYYLSDISSIVGNLRNARFNYADLCIYVDKKYKSKFKDFEFSKYLDLPEKSDKKPKYTHINEIPLIPFD